MARLPGYLRAVPGSRGTELVLRRWHPGYWACVLRAVLRKVGVLPLRCPNCNGHGRVVTRARLRRRRCAFCHGTGNVRKVA